jgi:cytoskeletal protein CcmA (bactofilin family)
MFKRDEGARQVETIIGPSVKVEGDFVAAGDVIVEGMLNGNLRTDQHLQVGEQAKITANVHAGSALVAGEIQGNVTVRENLEVTASGKIFGDLKAKVVTVAAGAQLNGKCQIGEERPAPKKVPAETKPMHDHADALRGVNAKLKVMS